LEYNQNRRLEGKLVKAQQVISMSLKERDQIKVLENLKNRLITQQQAADALRLSLRQIQRKIKAFLLYGDLALAHKNRGRPSNRRTNEDIVKIALKLIREKYSDFGPTFAAEMLEEKENIKLNSETLRLLMIRGGIWHKKARKVKSRRWRKRKACFGALIQLDGSQHDWFEGRRDKCSLLLFIDDATSEVVWLEFAESESYEGVMAAAKNYFRTYGRPVRFYTDYGCVYAVNLNNQERFKKTQFERALAELDIGISHASSPAAKGRAERSFKTHQDRLPKLLRLEGISTITEANEYLRRVYMPKHNKKFSVEAESSVNMHRSIDGFDLDNILCLKDERVLTNDWTIVYKTRYLQLHKDQRAVLFPKNKITVHEHLDGTLKLLIRNIELDFTILPERPQKRVIERQPKELPQPKKPAANHPWRRNPSCNTQRSEQPRISNALSR
jgi:transposase